MTEDITRTFTRRLIYDALEFDPSEAVSVFSEVGIEKWLAKHPFERIEFSPTVKHEDREVHGLYSALTQEIQIATTRCWGVIQPFRWGEIQTVSQTAVTVLEAIRKTVIHELGHHLHAQLLRLNKTQFIQTTLMVRTNAISHYGRINSREYFAECFTAWVFYRTEFIVRDELGYAMMQRALLALAIEVNEL